MIAALCIGLELKTIHINLNVSTILGLIFAATNILFVWLLTYESVLKEIIYCGIPVLMLLFPWLWTFAVVRKSMMEPAEEYTVVTLAWLALLYSTANNFIW